MKKRFKNHRIEEIGVFYWRIMEVRIKLKTDIEFGSNICRYIVHFTGKL